MQIKWLVIGKDSARNGISSNLIKFGESKVDKTMSRKIILMTTYANDKDSIAARRFYKKIDIKKQGLLKTIGGKEISEIIFYKEV